MKTSGVPRPKDKANSLYNGFFRYSDRRMGLFAVAVTPLSGDTGKIIAAKLTVYFGIVKNTIVLPRQKHILH